MTTTAPPDHQPPAHTTTDNTPQTASSKQSEQSAPASKQAESSPSKLSDFASLLMRAGM